jgi:hypothetical protein
MKTSKIIFIVLLSLITLYIVSAMIEVRITGKKLGKYNNTLKVSKKSLPAFSVMYLTDSKNITVIESDSSFIEVLVPEASAFPEISYNCMNDTLHIKDYKMSPTNLMSPSDFVSVMLHIASNLRTIKLVNSDILILNFNSKKISFDLEHSKVYFAINKSNNWSFGTMYISAKNNSTFTANSMYIDSLNIDLQNSVANLTVSIKSLSGNLKDNSKIFTKQPMEISLKRDTTSSVNFLGR